MTETRNRIICTLLIDATEILLTFVVLNYQCLLCLLIAHTAAMYRMLSEEINQLNEIDEEGNETEYAATPVAEREAFVKERLNLYIDRHCMILETIRQLKDLYSMPIGVNFISHGVVLCYSSFWTAKSTWHSCLYLCTAFWYSFSTVIYVKH